MATGGPGDQAVNVQVIRSGISRDDAWAVLNTGGKVRCTVTDHGFYMYRDGRQIRGRVPGGDTEYALGCANWPRTIGNETDLYEEIKVN